LRVVRHAAIDLARGGCPRVGFFRRHATELAAGFSRRLNAVISAGVVLSAGVGKLFWLYTDPAKASYRTIEDAIFQA